MLIGNGLKLQNLKIWVRLVAAVLLAVVLSGAGLLHWAAREQRHLAVDQAKDFANSVHQMTLAGLTGMMITGTISMRTIFLDQIKETNHIDSLKVVRGDAITRQFGPGFEGETMSDPVELMVIATGLEDYRIVTDQHGVERLRAVLPIRAWDNYLGKNCTVCHEVAVGTSLGVISMDISLARANAITREFTTNVVLAGLALCLPLGLLIWYFVSRLVSRPLRQMTDGLNHIAEGEIESSSFLPPRGADEVGLATQAFNRVMGKVGELLQQQRMMRIVFDNSLEGISVTDAKSRIQMVNKAFTDTTGYSADEAIGQTPALLKSGKQPETFYRDFWNALQKNGEWRGEIWNRRKNGSIYAEWLNVSAVKNPRGEVEHYVAIFSDITERKEREELITFQAFHDALTGLPNRILFRDRLEQALASAKRNKYRIPAVMFLDLDRFKQINDSLGHDAGDALLKEVANRLRRCIRNSDTVARFAGDEFTILLPEISAPSDANAVAEKVLAAMQEPIILAGEARVVTTSIGIALYPQDGQDAEELMKCADIAMYQVKGHGRAGKSFFTPELLGQPTRRAELEERLKTALVSREFELHYQPIVDLGSGLVCGKEALLRWKTAAGEVLYPDEFIGLAEEVGLMVRLGEWVLETACIQARAWQLEAQPVSVAVNLSAAEFFRPDLVEMLRDTLKRTGLTPQLLTLEVPEVLAMQDVQETERIFQGISALGVQLSIDDFGTGYSSLSALHRLQPGTLKIDQSLVRECLREQESPAVLAAIFGVAAAMGLKVVAEGVESEEQLAVLREFSCNRAQGYYFGAPAAEQAGKAQGREG